MVSPVTEGRLSSTNYHELREQSKFLICKTPAAKTGSHPIQLGSHAETDSVNPFSRFGFPGLSIIVSVREIHGINVVSLSARRTLLQPSHRKRRIHKLLLKCV